MSEFSIEKFGVRIDFVSTSPFYDSILDDLTFDFQNLRTQNKEIPTYFKVCLGETHSGFEDFKNLSVFFVIPDFRAYGWSEKRHCLFSNGTQVYLDRRPRKMCAQITGTENIHLRDLIYNLVHSVLGEELDARDWHRCHGLGFSWNETNCLLVANSGLGKSALGFLLSKEKQNIKLHSDECPLLRGSTLSAFPVRQAIDTEVAKSLGLASHRQFSRWKGRTKTVFNINTESIAKTEPLHVFFWGRRTGPGAAEIKTGSLRTLWAGLGLSMLVGYGLPQMALWLLRIHAIPRLTRIVFLRLRTLVQLSVKNPEIFEFHMSPDSYENLNCLTQFMQARHLSKSQKS